MDGDQVFFLDLLEKLTKENIKFIVCGGVAAVLHGVERLTVDIDLSLNMSAVNLSAFLRLLKHEGMVPRAPIPAESILDRDFREVMVSEKGAVVFTFVDLQNPYKQIDIFLTEENSFDRLIDDTDLVSIGDHCSVHIVNMRRLIEMKRSVSPPRDKDMRDIAALEILLKEK